MKEKKQLTYNEQITYYQEKKNSGLAFLVVSFILIIIGGIFMFLSYKYDILRVKHFVFGFEFYIALFAFIISLGLIVSGIVYLFISNKNLKRLKEETKLK